MNGLDLKKNRESLGLTQEELAKKVGKTKRTIISWEKSEIISPSNTTLLLSVFKELNKSENSSPKESQKVLRTKAGSTYEELSSGRFKLTVPFIPVRAQARYLSDFSDAEFISELDSVSFIVDRIGKGKYLAFEIQNDSMDDDSKRSIPDGAIVLGRELGRQHWTCKLKTRDFPYWIIVHKQGMLCKEITHHDVERGIITCHSLNDSPEYQDFDIKLDDCYQLFNIVKKQL